MAKASKKKVDGLGLTYLGKVLTFGGKPVTHIATK